MNKIKVGDIYISAIRDIKELTTLHKCNIYISIAGEAIVNQNPVICRLSKGHITYADGELARECLKTSGYTNAIKVPGVDLWIDYLKQHPCLNVFAIGGTAEVINDFAKKFKQDFPTCTLQYYCDGFDNLNLNNITQNITECKPDVVLIALGQPKQEELSEMLFDLHPAAYFCLGGSFDVFTGHVRRAPKILQQLKLEWIYRTIIQPKRLKRVWKLPFFYIGLKLGFVKIINVSS